MRIDLAEAARYLGCGDAANGALMERLTRCALSLDVCTPRSVSRHMAISKDKTSHNDAPSFDDAPSVDDTLTLFDMSIHSAALCAHLAGCHEVILFAATLGAEADRLIARQSCADMAEAVVLQAVAASAIECYCDECMAPLAAQAQERGLYLLPRFSPGYGDFDLAHQDGLLRLLDAGRAIGLSATRAHMLTPLKSVTALIGLSPVPPAPGCANKCAACGKTDCAYRLA